jgi:hypothetical protein
MWRQLRESDWIARTQLEIAGRLQQMGVRPGDRVAHIGAGWGLSWARLARVSIIAGVPQPEVDRYWYAGPEVQSQVNEVFRRAGARAIVAHPVPAGVPREGWQQIGNTAFHIYSLSDQPLPLARR